MRRFDREGESRVPLLSLSALATDLPIRKRRLAEVRRALAVDWRRTEGV